MENIRLTQFSHGGGCGCKIAPAVLEEILHCNYSTPANNKLLVGNSTNDDAAVYDLGNGMALISTTDFFMPIVDNPFDFGKIASANAISDVYAMGGKPVLALAVLGWPINKIPATVANKVIEGARAICAEAGIALAGGHSIDSPEPIFGLAVNGIVEIENLKRNDTAQKGDVIILTKPLGVGALATAQKKEVLTENQLNDLVKQLSRLNKAGEVLGKIKGVHAMTDVTGFGLGGHLTEMAEGSKLTAELHYEKLPIIPDAIKVIQDNIMPGATARNWESYGHKISVSSNLNEVMAKCILPDPQTNGGLLIAVAPDAVTEVQKVLTDLNIFYTEPIGFFVEEQEKKIVVI